MIRITITAEAFEIIRRECPDVAETAQRLESGDYWIWVFRKTINLFNALRQPHESYSDVILRAFAEH